jgi:hypothetical protein
LLAFRGWAVSRATYGLSLQNLVVDYFETLAFDAVIESGRHLRLVKTMTPADRLDQSIREPGLVETATILKCEILGTRSL